MLLLHSSKPTLNSVSAMTQRLLTISAIHLTITPLQSKLVHCTRWSKKADTRETVWVSAAFLDHPVYFLADTIAILRKFKDTHAVASLRFVSPGAVTDGITLFI